MIRPRKPNSDKREEALDLNRRNSEARHRDKTSDEKFEQLGAYPAPGAPPFTSQQIDEIVGASGKLPESASLDIDAWKTSLGAKLMELYQEFLFQRFKKNNMASPSKMRKSFARIERCADELLVALETEGDDPSSMPFTIAGLLHPAAKRYALGHGGYVNLSPDSSPLQGREYVQQAIEGIVLLRKSAKDVQAHAKDVSDQRRNAAKPRHSEDAESRQLFCSLGKIWRDYFETRPAISVDSVTGTPRGRFFRFVKTVLCLMRSNVTAEMKVCDPSLVADLTLTDQTIRTRFRTTKLRRKKEPVR